MNEDQLLITELQPCFYSGLDTCLPFFPFFSSYECLSVSLALRTSLAKIKLGDKNSIDTFY